MVKIENITLYGQDKKAKILSNASCVLQVGKVTAFIGKSGAGKSSLFSAIAQLKPYQGQMYYNGKTLQNLSSVERAGLLGLITQNLNLFPHLTCLQNCIQPQVVVLKVTQDQAVSKAREILASLAVEDLAERYPHTLSGGQQQRVAIARALCLNPKIMLFDEPTSALDPEMAQIVATLLRKLSREGMIIGVVTHDMKFLEAVSDVVYHVQDGKIVELPR